MLTEKTILLIQSMDEAEIPFSFVGRLDTLDDLGKDPLKPLCVFSESCQMPMLLSCSLVDVNTVLLKLVENRSAHICSGSIDLADSGSTVWPLPDSVVGIPEALRVLMLNSFSLLQRGSSIQDDHAWNGGVWLPSWNFSDIKSNV